MQRRNWNPSANERWKLAAVIVVLLAMVLLPVGKAYWPIERARWLVAAADNAASLGTKDSKEKAQALLELAIASYPEIENSVDFARTRFQMNPKETERAIKLVRSLSPRRQADEANHLAMSRFNDRDFDAAYEILLAGYPSPPHRTAVQRNQLAYYAALANRNLDVALADIDKALSEAKSASLSDTKAWVLFRLGRFDDALKAIDQAMAELDGELKGIRMPTEYRSKLTALLDGKEPFVRRSLKDESNPLASIDQDFADMLKSILVIHYHRGEILESSGKIDEADQEYSWVQDRGFNDFDDLY